MSIGEALEQTRSRRRREQVREEQQSSNARQHQPNPPAHLESPFSPLARRERPPLPAAAGLYSEPSGLRSRIIHVRRRERRTLILTPAEGGMLPSVVGCILTSVAGGTVWRTRQAVVRRVEWSGVLARPWCAGSERSFAGCTGPRPRTRATRRRPHATRGASMSPDAGPTPLPRYAVLMLAEPDLGSAKRLYTRKIAAVASMIPPNASHIRSGRCMSRARIA